MSVKRALILFGLLFAAVTVFGAEDMSGPAGRFIKVGGSIDLLGDVDTTGKISGNCLTWNGSDWAAATCGSGGGGSSTLSIFNGAVQVSSPTSIINFSTHGFTVTLTGAATAAVSLNSSSATLQGNNFNAANKLLKLDSSGLVPNAQIDGSSVSKLGNSIAIGTETTGSYVSAAIADEGISISDLGSNQVSIGVVTRAINGDRVWSDGGSTPVTWSWDVTGTDPSIQFDDDLVRIANPVDAPEVSALDMFAENLTVSNVSVTELSAGNVEASTVTASTVTATTISASSGSIAGLWVTSINGSAYPPTGSGGGGGFWIGNATSSLNMGGFTIYNSTAITTSSFTVTGATIVINGISYIRTSASNLPSATMLPTYTSVGGKLVETMSEIITNGVTETSTNTKTAPLVMRATFTVPTTVMVGSPDGIGEVALSSIAFSSTMGTLATHDGVQVLNVVVTTNTPQNDYVPKYDSTSGKVRWEADAGGSGSGTPGGSHGQLQINDDGAFAGTPSITVSTTTNVITITTSVVQSAGGVTYNNVPLTLLSNSSATFLSSVTVSGPISLSTVTTSSATVSGPLTAQRIIGGTSFTESGNSPFLRWGTSSKNDPFAAVNVDDSVIVFNPFRLLDLYQSGTIRGGIGYRDSTPAGFVIYNDAGSFKHVIGFDGSFAVGGDFFNGNKFAVSGGVGYNVHQATQSFSATLSTSVYVVNATAGNVIVTMPNIGTSGLGDGYNTMMRFCKTDTSTNTVTFTAPGASDTIDSVTLSSANACVDFFGDKTGAGSSTVGKWRNVMQSGTSSGGSGSGDIEGVTAGDGLTGGGTSGTVSLAVNFSSVTALGPTLEDSEIPNDLTASNYQPLDSTLTDLASAPLTEDNSVDPTAIASGSMPGDVLVSSFPMTGVTAGSYTNTSLTVNAQGIITAASNGAGSGGGDNFGSHTATKTATFDFGMTVSTITFSNTGGWSARPASTTFLVTDTDLDSSTMTIPGIAVEVVAFSTYIFNGKIIVASDSSGSGGLRFTSTGPVNTASFRLNMSGGTTGPTAGNFAANTATMGTLIGTSLAAGNSQTWDIPFTAHLVTGDTGGTFAMRVVKVGGAGTYTFRAISTHMRGEKMP